MGDSDLLRSMMQLLCGKVRMGGASRTEKQGEGTVKLKLDISKM